MQTESKADEIKRLERCINDLIVILALPAIWTGHEPSHIANTLLDVLLRMLRLDFAYLRLGDSVEGCAREWARSTGRPDIQPREIGRKLESWLNAETPDAHSVLSNPVGSGTVSTALFPLGPQDEIGSFVAGSQRADFPTDIEQLLMRVAANEAAIGLQEARYVRQQRLATKELERRVRERTAELASVNEKLRREILERHRATELSRDLAGRLIASQELERQRIARELHDDLGQKISLLGLEVDQVASQIDAGALRSRLQKLSGDAREIAGDVHNLSRELHPSKLQMLGLPSAMRSLCDDISKQVGVQVTFTHSVLPQQIDPNVSLCLYRITQEALHNIARHSGAPDAQVRLTRDDDNLTLQIADSGVGFNPGAEHAGLGLVSMRERVAFLKGRLAVDSVPGGGTRIEVRVPCAPEVRDSASPVD